MQKLMQSRIFRLLSETSQRDISTIQLDKSCDEFAIKVLTRIQFEENHQELYFSLGFIHSKLAGVCEQLSGEQGKKCPKNRSQSHVFGGFGNASVGMANHSTEKQNEVFF